MCCFIDGKLSFVVITEEIKELIRTLFDEDIEVQPHVQIDEGASADLPVGNV